MNSAITSKIYSVLSIKEAFAEHKFESDNILKVKLQKNKSCPLLSFFFSCWRNKIMQKTK